MKLKRKILVALSATALIATPLVYTMPMAQAVQAQTVTQRLMSLGASLSAAEAEQTKMLLGANQLPIDQMMYIDGNTINRYLNDGSNASTGVFSSALIEPLPAGSGVQVQIITPQNIQLVKPVTYQNAAITSGAKDILIKIATVKPVTGEGALTGVYALLEKSGMAVDQKAVVVAEKEIQIVEQAKKESEVTDIQINQLMVEVKSEVTRLVSSGQPVDGSLVVKAVLANHPNIILSAATMEVLVQLANEFATTEAAKKADTIDTLKDSINNDLNRPYFVNLDQYGNDLNFVRAGYYDPTDIVINHENRTISLNQGSVHFGYEVESIDTKEFTVLDEMGQTRKVFVNTRLKNDALGEMYLYINKEGSLSVIIQDMDSNGHLLSDNMLEFKIGELPSVDERDLEPETTVVDESQTQPEESQASEPGTFETPFAVDLANFSNDIHFTRSGMNIPLYLTLKQDLATLKEQHGTEQSYTVKQIPTKEITVFNHTQDGGTRPIQVNTQIEVMNSDQEFYLFINNDGKLSLATPNFAGNVTPDQAHIMLEYVAENLKEYSVLTQTISNASPFMNEHDGLQIFIDPVGKTVRFVKEGIESTADYTVVHLNPFSETTLNKDGLDSREVTTSTVLQLDNFTNNSEIDYSGDISVIYNAEGGISILTPNYFGIELSGGLSVEYAQ